jgi:hypothetical protein
VSHLGTSASVGSTLARTPKHRTLRGVRAASAVLLAVAFCLALGAGSASAAPAATTVTEVSEVSYASAHFKGTVESTGYWIFQVSTDETNWASTNAEGFSNGEATPQPVEANASAGLQGGTKYFVRLVGYGETGPVASPGPYLSFTTLPVEAPTVLGVHTDAVDNHTATLSGEVRRPANANHAFDAECRFEYITDESFQPRNEKQRLTIRAGAGTYTLSFANPAGSAAQTTAPIAAGASAATVQAALAALSNIGPGSVSVNGGPGNKTGAFPYTITFAGTLAAKNLEPISVDPSNLTEPGGAETTTVTEGHAEGFDGATPATCVGSPFEAPGDHEAKVKLLNLAAHTTYHLRLTATNKGGTDFLVAPNFATTSVITAQTLSPSGVTTTQASLAGRVNAENAPLTYQFKWGTTAAYGNVVPAAPESLATADESPHVVAEPLAGLAPGTTYHYRIVATNTATGEVAEGEDQTFQTLAIVPPSTCPNESSRVDNSEGLPDCRAIEFASPGLNGAGISGPPSELPKGAAQADGDSVIFQLKDAPLDSHGSAAINYVTAEKKPGGGWKTRSLDAPLAYPVPSFFSVVVSMFNADHTEWEISSSVPPSREIDNPEYNGSSIDLYFHHADGTWSRITRKSMCCGVLDAYASPNFKHLLFPVIENKQWEEDPGGFYEYNVDADELRHPGVLPNGTTAGDASIPAGGGLNPTSDDGEILVFYSGGQPYLRIADSETREIGKSRKAIPDPVGPQPATPLGVTPVGNKAYFLSRSELTEDANTGINDAGNDLYSYDVAGGELTDLTPDTNPADAETGANVQQVVAVNRDGSYVYFIATGKLAPGAISGQPNLYVRHGNETTFIAPGEGYGNSTYVTPDGTHLAFTSSASLTGYDNLSRKNNSREQMAFEYTYGGGIVCGSCRPSGASPNGPALFPVGAGYLARVGNRVLSDDGSRMFFQSADRILPQASNGKVNVYEFTEGEVHLLTPGDTEAPVYLLDASASGDDVYITANEELNDEAEGTNTSIYDVRVNADLVPPNTPTPCTGENCRGPKTTAPPSVAPASSGFEAPATIIAPKSMKGKKAQVQLRVYVPADGQLRVSGTGLKAASKTAKAPGFVTITAALRPQAVKKRDNRGVFKSSAELLFTPGTGEVTRAAVALRFEAPTKKKGGK